MKKNARQISRRDVILIDKIADRAMVLGREAGVRPGRISLIISISMAHRFRPIDLDLLLACDDANFSHDVWGILRHINPHTGELRDCFVPRTAKPQHQVAAHG